MEALIQHGQGRKSFFVGTVLSSYQKVSAQKYLMASLRLSSGSKRMKQDRVCLAAADQITAEYWPLCLGLSTQS